jgi:hypothetical protein
MDALLKDKKEIRLRTYPTNRKENFKSSNVWNCTTKFLSVSNSHRLDTIQWNTCKEKHAKQKTEMS